MASGAGHGRQEQKDDWPAIMAAVGAIVLAANTAYLHPYTAASNIISAVGLAGLILGLLFIVRRRLAQFKARVSRLLHSLKRTGPAPSQHQAVQSRLSASPAPELAIGIIATLLPFVLIYGAPVAGAGSHVLASLSEYYYSPMRNILVGGLCVLGVLLMLSTGDNPMDNRITNLAGLTCIGVALFPVHSAAPSTSSLVIGLEHNIFIFLMYIALGAMSLRFAASEREPGARVTRVTHLACGYCIFAFLLLAEFSVLVPSARRFPAILSGETAALMAAGVSWFVRGLRLVPRANQDRTPVATMK